MTLKKITDKVVCDGFNIEYFKFGRGKKTLVILPGLSVQSVLISAPFVEEKFKIFKEDYTVYLFDRRSNLPDEYSVYDMATDIMRAASKLGLTDIYLYGASQGGMIAMYIAVDYPALVEKLALASTAAYINDDTFCSLSEWIKYSSAGDREGLYLSFAEKLYTKEYFNNNREAVINLSKTVTDEELKRFTVLAKCAWGFDIRGRLEEIKCPVFLIGDTDDRVLGYDATKEIIGILNNKKNFESFIYSGYGHAVYDFAPDYIGRLLEFFNR